VESPVAEQLKRISEQLKITRETAGIPLEQVASQTFIPLRLLKAMDEGKFERLPEPVFVQGFIRRYGDAVGLDGKQLALEFVVDPPTLKKPAEEFLSYHPEDDQAPRNARNNKKSKLAVPLPPPPEPAPVAPVAPVVAATEPVTAVAPIAVVTSAPVIEPTPIAPTPIAASVVEPALVVEPVVESTPVVESEPKREPALTFDPTANREWAPSAGNTSSGGNQWIYWLSGLAALGLLAIGTLLVLSPKPESNAPTPTVPTTAAPTPKLPVTAVPTTTPKSNAPIVLTIKVIEDSWIEVLSDGKSAIAEVLPKGTQKTWTAKERLSITSGNAKGVTYSYNQSPEKPMGATADPDTLVFPP
jgi:cytoskeleton protein RodZ